MTEISFQFGNGNVRLDPEAQRGSPQRHEAADMPEIRPLTIGSVTLASNLMLAPVANYCDLAFRITCREQGGLGLACTDLLSPQGLLRGSARSLDLAATNAADQPIGMQLYGGDGDILADGARWAVDHGATIIDINMGCPVDKVTKKDGGSKLLCDPCNTVRIAERIVDAVSVPVTAKMRLGWSSDRIVAPELARALEGVGIRAVTVHGRTTEQKFKGEVDLEGIRRVVEAVERIPVIGNGDVKTVDDARRMMTQTGCAGLMIGRGAFSAPWIFNEIWTFLTTGRRAPEPTEAEKIAIVRGYFERMLEHRDAHYAMTHMRRRISWFGKRLGPCKPLKEAVRLASDPGAVHRALDDFLAGGLRRFEGDAPGGTDDEA